MSMGMDMGQNHQLSMADRMQQLQDVVERVEGKMDALIAANAALARAQTQMDAELRLVMDAVQGIREALQSLSKANDALDKLAAKRSGIRKRRQVG